MSWYDRFSKLCNSLFALLIQLIGALRQHKAELSDQEIAALLTMSSACGECSTMNSETETALYQEMTRIQYGQHLRRLVFISNHTRCNTVISQ